MKRDKVLILVAITSIVLLLSSGTYAYWTWRSADTANTTVNFTLKSAFSCSADGGGSITPSDSITIVPSTCTNTSHVIKRTVTTKVTLDSAVSAETVYLNMWLYVNSINSYLAGTSNFKYALTTSSANCTTGVVKTGNFSGTTTGSKVNLLSNVAKTATANDTYYLWIWLDKAETGTPPTGTTDSTHKFTFTLAGDCSQGTN